MKASESSGTVPIGLWPFEMIRGRTPEAKIKNKVKSCVTVKLYIHMMYADGGIIQITVIP